MPFAVASLCTLADAKPVSAITVAGIILLACSCSRILCVASRPSMIGMDMSASGSRLGTLTSCNGKRLGTLRTHQHEGIEARIVQVHF